MLSNWQAGPLGASRVEQNIHKFLLDLATIRQHDNTTRKFGENDLRLAKETRVVEDICVRFCFVTSRERGLKIQLNGILFNKNLKR